MEKATRNFVLITISYSIFLSSSFAINTELALGFLKQKNVNLVTCFVCNQQEFTLAKKLQSAGVRSNFPNLEKITSDDDLYNAFLNENRQPIGVLVDMKCNNSEFLLKMASEKRFFDNTQHWLIFPPEHFTQEEFEEAANNAKPENFNIQQYLEDGNNEMLNGETLRNLNLEINKNILLQLDVKRTNTAKEISPINSYLNVLIGLEALVDSEVTLAVPNEENDSFNLYDIHRITQFTEMKIESRNESDTITKPAILKRKNFEGALLRGISEISEFEYYNKSEDLSSKKFDYYGLMGLQITTLAEKHLNFRMIVKCVEDKGWQKNEKLKQSEQYLSEHKADMSSSGLLMQNTENVAFVDSSLVMSFGLLFNKPPLSQVTNIFSLAFAPDVWMCLTISILVSAMVLYYQFWKIDEIQSEEESYEPLEIYTFLAGAILQQGTELKSSALATRTTMFIFSILTLLLFITYTANIVVFLQSPSNSINNLQDFIDSDLEMAMENTTLQRLFLEEDENEIIREMYEKKLAGKILTKEAFLESDAGMEHVRVGMFGFHVGMNTGAEIISKEFTEAEKCRLKSIDMFPNRFYGLAVPKKSPFYEIFAQEYRLYREVGLISRIRSRYTCEMPNCGTNDGGYYSIGLLDVKNILYLLIYGNILSVVIFIFEKLYFWSAQRSIRFQGFKGKKATIKY